MANAQRPVWSSDTKISVPLPPADGVLVPMYGFGWSQFGLVHDLSSSDYEYMRTPTYAPELPTGDVIYDDIDTRRT